MPQADKKIIVKNTLALYLRMIFVMAVTLFTSRIILEKLGVTEYGVYSAVGGVVAMLGFLNGTLSTGTSRFLTFELGTGDKEKLRQTFSTAFHTHLILAIFVVVILAVGGTWFVLNELIIPDNLKMPALWTFYLSVFTTFISITQVPYTSVIIAHERMNIYAYMGIFEAVSKLGVAYAISIAPIEKLVWYALLIAGVQLVVAIAYRVYCIRNYSESRISKTFNRGILKSMLGFSGWSLMANVSEILGTQGLIVLVNMFFVPAIAAAQAVANQISSAISQFSTNFITAINPQIIKLYASGELEASRKLNLQTTVLIWDLMLFIGLPLIVCMDPLIKLWLVDSPPYAIIFSQYIVARAILATFNVTFYIPMVASGELKTNAKACVWLGIGEFVLLYILLRSGFGVMWVQYLAILQCVAFSMGVKPYVLYRKIGYSIKEIIACYWQCFKSAIIPVISCFVIPLFVDANAGIWYMVATALCLMLIVMASSFIFMDYSVRLRITSIVKDRFHIGKYS